MEPAELIEHCGYTILVTALEVRSGSWTALYVLAEDGALVFRAENAYPFPMCTTAVQRALAVVKVLRMAISGLP